MVWDELFYRVKEIKSTGTQRKWDSLKKQIETKKTVQSSIKVITTKIMKIQEFVIRRYFWLLHNFLYHFIAYFQYCFMKHLTDAAQHIAKIIV